MSKAPENLNPEADAQAPDPSRRNWLRGMVAAPIAAGALSAATPPAQAAGKLATKAHIVIVGSGMGGIAVASRLMQQLDGARITIVDRKEEHHYQPGYTLVASGIWPVE